MVLGCPHGEHLKGRAFKADREYQSGLAAICSQDNVLCIHLPTYSDKGSQGEICGQQSGAVPQTTYSCQKRQEDHILKMENPPLVHLKASHLLLHSLLLSKHQHEGLRSKSAFIAKRT